MSGGLSLSVNFQSRAGTGLECTPEMVLVSSADMKALKAKTGSYVKITAPSSTFICQAWSSKKAVAGTVTLNKLWSANFSTDQKKVKLTIASSAW